MGINYSSVKIRQFVTLNLGQIVFAAYLRFKVLFDQNMNQYINDSNYVSIVIASQ